MPAQIDQLLALLDQQDLRVRTAFVDFVNAIRSPEVLDQIIQRLEANDLPGATRIIDSYIARFANVIPEVITTVGIAAAAELDAELPDVAAAIVFDPTNPRAAALISTARSRLIRDLSDQQYASIQQAISREVAVGAGAQRIGRAVRDSIGLTANQEAYVNSYRQQLEQLDARALDRALRDARYDQRFTTAIERDRALTSLQIDTMVQRYRDRAIASRAETIARTEALTAYSQAREESLLQMVAQTRLNSSRVTRIWYATHDDRVREWHLSMDGQEQPMGEPFIDGLGNLLMYPGDPAAPAESVINCRCTTGFNIEPAT